MGYFKRALARKLNQPEGIHPFAMHLKLREKPLKLRKSSNIHEQHRWAVHYCRDAKGPG